MWYNKSVKEIESNLRTNIQTGLNKDEYSIKLNEYGYNKLKEKKSKNIVQKFIDQLKDFMVIILIIAAIISFFLGERTDSMIIIAIVILNATLGVIQESKAEKSLEALKKLSSPHANVIRSGVQSVISVEELVPGDVVLIEAGDYIPADVRIVESVNLKVEESSLTGESIPVDKICDTLNDENLSLGDRKNMAFMGSLATYGRGRAIVVETAMNTEIGKIAQMINTAEEQQTPLQNKLEELGKILGILALGICGLIFAVGMLRGHEMFEMFMTSISLAVAAIPEGLPSIVTIVLALGVQKMIKRNAIIRKLPAVETLGAARVICSDKTGTLTQNKMTIERIYCNNSIVSVKNLDEISKEEKILVEYGVLCNDTKAQYIDGNWTKIGDPTEVSIIDLAIETGHNPIDIVSKHERCAEIPFDSNRKLMTTVNNINGRLVSITKGAPDILINKCSKILSNNEYKDINDMHMKIINEANENMANDALRVLAIGYKDIDCIPCDISDLEKDLNFLGLYGMIDPPREEAKEAVKKCKSAGIKTVMITGDHKNTAIAIAKQLDILKDEKECITGVELEKMSDDELVKNVKKYSTYARVSPEHKVRIVKAWQNNGEIVAMTGDGVNDAPALKTADIGAAMGITGTEVAKGAADMVLADDNFATIVSSVEEGRTIFANIRKSIHFLLSCNIGEIALIFIATLIGMPSPLLPIHILWVNLVTDGLTALALGIDPPEKDIMNRPPRRAKASVFSDGLGFKIGYQGFMIGALAFNAFLLGLPYDYKDGFVNGYPVIAQTMAFMTLSFSQLVHSFNTRSDRTSLFDLGFFKNKYLVGAVVISGLLQYSVISTEFTRNIFKITSLRWEHWLEVIILSLLPILIVEFEKSFNKKEDK
jgi:P-type Ca2+ transporter type 2C